MPTIPELIDWRTAPLTVTLICEDREAPDCQDRVTVHVTEEDAARLYRKRPVGAGGAWHGALAAQAPGWEYKYPFAPAERMRKLATEEQAPRVMCGACLEDIAQAYHRPRPPAPPVPPGHVAWWDGCRTFRLTPDTPRPGIAVARGRWLILTEAEAAARDADIKARWDKVGKIMAEAGTRRYRQLFGAPLPDIDDLLAWLKQHGTTWTDFSIGTLRRDTLVRMVEGGPPGGWRFADEVTGKARPATEQELEAIRAAVRAALPAEPPPAPKPARRRRAKGGDDAR